MLVLADMDASAFYEKSIFPMDPLMGATAVQEVIFISKQ